MCFAEFLTWRNSGNYSSCKLHSNSLEGPVTKCSIFPWQCLTFCTTYSSFNNNFFMLIDFMHILDVTKDDWFPVLSGVSAVILAASISSLLLSSSRRRLVTIKVEETVNNVIPISLLAKLFRSKESAVALHEKYFRPILQRHGFFHVILPCQPFHNFYVFRFGCMDGRWRLVNLPQFNIFSITATFFSNWSN